MKAGLLKPRGERTFISSVVAMAMKISQRRLTDWTEKRFIVPEIEAEGTGSRREYSLYNLLEIELIITLKKMGIALYAIKDILEALRDLKNGDIKAQREFLHQWLDESNLNEFLKKMTKTRSERYFKEQGALQGKIPYMEIFAVLYSNGFREIIITQKFDDEFQAKLLQGSGILVINFSRIKKEVARKLREAGF